MDMDKDQESPKKCFCARCFLPIEPEDKVDIDGQNFHRVCSMCCICRTIPTSLKMFYGHVFCNECFKNHVLSRFKGESPRMHSNSWWMQWAPGVKPPQQQRENEKDENAQNADHTEKPETDEKEKDKETCKEKSDPAKKCICARCLQAVDEAHKVDIGGQSFHPQCARCYFCHCVPKDNVKIYYGQVFCEDCFHRHVLNRNRDNPSEFFRNCFDQWQNNAQFAEHMKDFLAGSERAPFIFMMQQGQQGAHLPSCGCGTNPHPKPPKPEWFQTNANETKKCA
ncbi:cysteine and glycine-rich protein 2-like isoform X2 [Hyposmocoma kahamanoa]|uniref:cysteine and glycine-rich protein 2-like isoform X2 n=1 Tax=Hyposmocoma kahamanoa TaxID=1477025 RepID=UPI000E6DA45D|nr:cysteine and glycine-rich protein 2-like isoform X2 [Hyposmocoma kahamanoa]